MAGADARRVSIDVAPWVAAGVAGAGLFAAARAVRAGRRPPQRPPEAGPRVVILGAGFAGMQTARSLRRRIGNRARITMIDRHNYHLFTPMLYQVAACAVDPYDIAYPVRQFTGRDGVAFRDGTVTGIDLNGGRVQLQNGEVGFDYLVIALGGTTDFFDNQSAQQHALPLKSLEDGVAIRNRLLQMLEEAGTISDANERRARLTFAVVGGGATGTETAAAICQMLHRTIPMDYPSLDLGESQIVLIESEGKLLGHMGEHMARIALDRLRGMGVEVWLNTRASRVSPDRLETENGRALQTRTVLWATGVRAPEVVASMDAPHGKGGSLRVDEYLQLEGYPGVFAVGDSAHVNYPEAGGSVPLLAAAAVQEGEAVAENVARAIEGRPQQPFHYRSLGNVVSLGRSAGVAHVGGVVVDGLVGNLLWRVVHLARITGFRNRLASALDWGVTYVYDENTALVELRPEREAATSPATAAGALSQR